ncbi:MAG: hypothetical protein KAR32_01785, partial [Candidatus Omnitrophica bacterium]|nr:hypothetical protein [Candidatus Omnitrophota bacterium]
MGEGKENLKKELFFGLVGAAGTDLSLIDNLIKDNLKVVGYNKIIDIRLSALLQNVEVKDEDGNKIELVEKPEEKRISAYMDAGNSLRKDFEQGDALALLSVNKVSKERKKVDECEKIAYILRSLKHPDEVHTLRRIYGESFFLIGVYSSHDKCIRNLSSLIARSHETADEEKFTSEAEKLYERDADEHDKLGQ